MNRPVPTAIRVIVCTIRWICASRVLVLRAVLALRCATWPNSVSLAVAYTSPSPRPEATVQPASSRLVRSRVGRPSLPWGSASRATGSASPVSTDRSTYS